MRKIGVKLLVVLLFAVAALSVGIGLAVLKSFQRPVVVFSAPTLRGLSDELSRLTSMPLDVRVHGSVLAANLIKSGKVPDLFLSVDSELKEGLNFRSEKLLGVYRLVLVCTTAFDGLDALKTARIGIADPNQAPIGYRALAALYLLSKYENLGLKKEVEESLNIRYSEGSSVTMDLVDISPSGRFYMRPNLDFVGSLLEAGVVDCIFAHIPFVVVQNLNATYNVIELPKYARFDEDPPVKIIAHLKTGEIKVIRFEAIALTFSESGDKLLKLFERVDVTKYGIFKPSD